MTDRLTLTRAFEEAGIDSPVAEHIATEIYDAIHANVATKADIDVLRGEITVAVRDLKVWGLSTMATVVGAGVTILFAALHYWPPH